MAKSEVVRWEPTTELAERPAETFDVEWQGSEMRLAVTVRYATQLGEDEKDANSIVIFENVHSFMMFDEWMDDGSALVSQAAGLRVSYPYGGRWPFLEVISSTWIAELVLRDGARDEDEFRHFVITSRNMHLHVACQRLSTPTYHK